ncbi:NADH-quinone oxidoreductase subunit H [Skermania sp. ID1734]|nr:NADH-quinone oxidoreductase subunit H [Skermania sp. ID1734]
MAVTFEAVVRAAPARAPLTAAMAEPLRSAAFLLVQQRRVLVGSDRLLWRAGAMALMLAAVLAAAVVPFGNRVVADSAVSLVWFNAMEVVAWAAVWLAGWGPNSTFSLVGGYRFVAQGLAYELPHMFALITVAVGAGSLRVADVVAAQQGLWFVVWMPAAFVVYLLSVLAMSFMPPFRQAVSSDIAGGVLAELSGVDRLVFLTGRWSLFVAGAAMAVPLFLGGGSGPLLPAWLWSVIKTVIVVVVLVWAGRRVPTMRMERFEEFSWVVLLPVMLVQTLIVSILAVA